MLLLPLVLVHRSYIDSPVRVLFVLQTAITINIYPLSRSISLSAQFIVESC